MSESLLIVDDVVCARAEVAATLAARRRGLLGRTGIDGALLLSPARQVHTFGMQFPIDVAWCDRRGTVLRVATLEPARLGAFVWRSRSVIEAAAGAFSTWQLGVGSAVRHTVGVNKAALVLVATPIGNLGDLSPRAAEALGAADTIACEDTRRTGRLLAHLGISAPRLLVVNEHTEYDATSTVVERIRAGERVVLVSDAGMPGISDPGELCVRAVIDAGFPVEVVPGPSAADTMLVASGLPTGRFVFEGFLPRKGAERAARLTELAGEGRTTVLYEAPHRLARTLRDLAEKCGADRRVAIGRELTKVYEELWRGTVGEALARTEEVTPRGEYVVVLAGADAPPEPDDDDLIAAINREKAAGASTRDAVDAVAGRHGVSKRRVYALAIG